MGIRGNGRSLRKTQSRCGTSFGFLKVCLCFLRFSVRGMEKVKNEIGSYKKRVGLSKQDNPTLFFNILHLYPRLYSEPTSTTCTQEEEGDEAESEGGISFSNFFISTSNLGNGGVFLRGTPFGNA